MKFVVPKSIATAPAPAPAGASARQKKTQAELRKSGGRRVPFNLRADALAAIERIKARDGHKTALEAVTAALLAHAAQK